MKRPSRSKSPVIVFPLFAAVIAAAALSGSGCNDRSGGNGTGGTSAIGAAGAGGGAGATGGAGGQAGGGGGEEQAGGAAGGGEEQAGGAAGGGAGLGGAAGGSAGLGGAAGSLDGAKAACAATAPATSGIDPTTRLDSLTLAQKAAFCDWAASRYCGYDKHVACADNTTLDSFLTQADCVDNMTATSCAATVGDSEACEKDSTCADPFPDSCLPASMCQ